MFTRATFLIVLVSVFALQGMSQLKRADRKYGRLVYASAIKSYEKHLKKNPGDSEAIARLADCYRRINNFEKAEMWFTRAVKYRNTDPINYFYLGQAKMNNKKWEEAVPWFEKYLESKPDDVVGQAMLSSSRNISNFMQDSSLYDVKITNINTEEADFSPNIWNGKVYFASARKQGDFWFGWTARPFLELFASDYYGSPELGEPELVKGRVNSKLHEAHVSFSPDGKTMFFSRNNIIRGKVGKSSEGVIRLKTYRSDLGTKKWGKLKPVPFNSDEYSVGHPALSPDGNTLYFVSDMPGGMGGTDIYAVPLDIEKGSWGKPVNLGPEINTPGNEMFPWMSESNMLYFSSNGKPGMGGLDLFRIQLTENQWGTAKNMGYPINSARDDFALVYDEARGVGFFSSNRTLGVGDDDIYSFKQKQVLRGVVVDAVTGEKLDNARVEVYDARALSGLSRTEEGIFNQGVYPEKDYFAVASKEGYEEKRMRFSTKGKGLNDEVVVEIPLVRVQNCPEPLAFQGTLLDDDGKPLPNRKVKLIEKERVVTTDENGNIYADLDPDKDYEFIYDGPEVKDPVSRVVNTDDLIPMDTAKAKLVVDMPDSGDVFYIIYYNFDKYDIRNWDARPELDRVVKFMSANPQVKIELSSHTDSRGTNMYNENLSRNRAIEAFTYITGKGISKGRLSWKNFGEYNLTNKCADGVSCSEEAHQLNRRTEFMINGFIQQYTD